MILSGSNTFHKGQTMKRAFLLVLDGMGIGAMDDVVGSRPQDT